MAANTDKPTLNTKNLIQNFESGDITQDTGPMSPTEKVTSRPGVTKKMVNTFESKNQGGAPTGAPKGTAPAGPKRSTSVTIPQWVDDKVEGEKLKVLIVFCHPEKKSFNSQLLASAVETLKKNGHEVTVSDLYEMKFNNTPSREDVVGEPSNKEFFDYANELGVAYEKGTLAQDILTEQQKVRDADLVIFQFPFQWGGLPAMLKGWFDRVLCKKFAFDDMQVFDYGLLQGKRALLSFTCGGGQSMYSNTGLLGDMNVVLWPIQNLILRLCGFAVLPPHIVYGVRPTQMDDKSAKQAIRNWQIRMRSVEKEPPLAFVPLSFFDSKMQLSGEGPKFLLADGKEAVGFGPTVGQHGGKTFPADGQLKSGLQIILEKLQDNVANPPGGTTPEGKPQELAAGGSDKPQEPAAAAAPPKETPPAAAPPKETPPAAAPPKETPPAAAPPKETPPAAQNGTN